jgi:hypothetical protein
LEIEEGVTITGYVLEHIRDEEPVARESKTEAEKAEAVAENA